MIRYNVPVVVVRGSGDGETRLEMMAVVDSKKIFLPVDADIEEGDQVEQLLPNGKRRVLQITEVDVLQSPFGTGSLDHTEAAYTTASAQASRRGGGDTFNVRATNVQVATGDQSQQTMTIGQTADELVLVVKGISEILLALNLVEADDPQLGEVQKAAIDDVTSDTPTASGVRRFYEWVLDCARKGGTTAVVAAVTAASNGLLHDAEALVHAIDG